MSLETIRLNTADADINSFVRPQFSISKFPDMLRSRGYQKLPDFEEKMKKHDILYDIRKERYFICKVLGSLPHVIGDKARQAVTYFQYIRWMDEVCDNPQIEKSLKLQMLNRQHLIHRGSYPDSPLKNEKSIISLQCQDFTKSGYFKTQVDMLFATFIDDLDHESLEPRTKTEFRHYNYRVMLSISEILTHALNEKPSGVNSKLMKLFARWNEVGHLLDTMNDIQNGKLQFELTLDEYQQIAGKGSQEERAAKINEILTEDKFYGQKAVAIDEMEDNVSAIWATDFENWQKCLSYIYLKYRAIPKARRLIQFEQNKRYVHDFKSILPKEDTPV